MYAINLTNSSFNGNTEPVWKQSVILYDRHYTCHLFVNFISLCCCFHLVALCRNTMEGSTVYTWKFIDLSLSPPLSNSSKPSKQSKSASPPSKPLTLAYDGDVDMWSSSRWLYIQSTSCVQHFQMFIFPRHPLDFPKKKKNKEERETRSNIHQICRIHKTLYVRLQGQRFRISRHCENCDI